MKPEIVHPESNDLRRQVIEARDNLLTQRDLIKRIETILQQPMDTSVREILVDCKQFLLDMKQQISHRL